MTTQYDQLKREAEGKVAAKDFHGALPLYEKLCQQFPQMCTEWEWWRYAQCLRKEGKSKQALDACREAYKRNKELNHVKNLYAWCVFDLEIKGKENATETELEKAFHGIEQLVDPYDEFAPYFPTLFALADHYDDQGKSDKLLSLLKKVDPAKTSSKSSEFQSKAGKKVQVASHKEKWYSLITKALFDLGKYNECIAGCKQALENFKAEELHYDNEIWFRRRIALCLAETGKIDEAIQIIKELIAKKKDWFFYADMARLLHKKGNLPEAQAFALKALQHEGEAEFKLSLFVEYARLLSDLKANEQEIALHCLIAVRIREEKKWKVPDSLLALAKAHHAGLDDDRSSAQLLIQAKKLWDRDSQVTVLKIHGEVATILPTGKAGFIRDGNGGSYYFRFNDVKKGKNKITAGSKVTFVKEEGFDKKKGKTSMVAVEIEVQ